MKILIDKTIISLKEIITPRFYSSERGFVNEFSNRLSRQIEDIDDLPNPAILEAEAQKRRIPHYGLTQRPDLIIHIPIETGLTKNANENNFAVYAFKLRGGYSKVQEDFIKLDEMFNYLNYSVGFFVNIGVFPNSYLNTYQGVFKDRIHEFSVGLDNGFVNLLHSYFIDGDLFSEQI